MLGLFFIKNFNYFSALKFKENEEYIFSFYSPFIF